MAERVYAESDWAVRRWDRFNDRLVKPLSFCQFWRTVLLYATIQQLLAPWRAVMRAGTRLSGAVSRLSRFSRFAPILLAASVALAIGGGGTVTGMGLVISFGIGIALGTILGFLMVYEPSDGERCAMRLRLRVEDLMIRAGDANLSLWRGLLHGVGHGLWLLVWPFRTFFPPLGRGVLVGAVTMGEPIEAYSKRHKDAINAIGQKVPIVLITCLVIGFVIIMLVTNWWATLAAIGFLLVAVPAAVVLVKGGIPQAVWRGFVAVMGLLWQAAVAAKHGVCPPVTITRRDEAA